MTPKQSKAKLLKRIESAEGPLDKLLPAAGVAAMLAFYTEQRAKSCPVDEEADTLLFQWGTHDWGDGKTFQLDITRQFVVADEDEPFQLSLTFHFRPNAALRALKSGNQWHDDPETVASFKADIEKSPAYLAVAGEQPIRVELAFESC